MWTAKRIMILIGSMLGILGGFSVYTLFLGVIDNLQALPASYLPDVTAGPVVIVEGPERQPDVYLQKAFGTGCEEIRRGIRYFFPEKGFVISAGGFDIEKSDGRVRMAPFSIAMFHKTKTPGAYPEISTIKCDVAFLTLDRPVSQFSELGNRKVEKVELTGESPRGVSIINNRKSAEKSDDIDILVTKGSLFFEERQHLIYTEGIVRLTDYKTSPPTIICGRGMELLLTKDSSTRPKRTGKNADNGGIERLSLRADVKMHFWVDARSGFLTGSQQHKKPAPVSKPPIATDDQPMPPNKAQIHVQTGGSFVYDLTKEFAWFESPPPRGNTDPLFPDHVHVARWQAVDGGKKFDQVTCDRLELQFRRKLAAGENDKEIETATATSRPENEVVLASDSEHLAATGNYLLYRAGDLNTGPLTILKGNPCRSVKDGHVMFCKELRMIGANRAGDGQVVDATGPGKIDLLDGKNPDPVKPSYPTHILWRDKLTVVKSREGNQLFDLIKVVGEASFIDEQQQQEMHGDEISVWIRQNQDNAAKSQSVGGSKQELHRVIAQGHVRARTPEYLIRQTNLLTMTFTPEIARDERLPEAVVVAKQPGIVVETKGAPKVTPIPAKEQPRKPRAPIEVEANDLTIANSTFGPKKKLQELIARGNVFVYQAGEKPGEKALDIQGQLLTLKQVDDAHVMVVSDPKRKAQVITGDTTLWGPQVTVNQGDNRAVVDGAGAMRMPSKTNLDGTNSKKGTTWVTIHWQKNMTFDGKYANFHGGVIAVQDDAHSRLACQDMTAMLDRFVSFKEPKKGDPNQPAAKIDKIICDQKVYIDDVKIDAKKQLERRTILEGREATMDNLETRMNLAGPGRVRTLGQGTSELAPAAEGASAAKGKAEWKLTRIEFMQRMQARVDDKTKIATFYGDVEVQYFPTTDIQAVMNPNNPAKDAMYLRSGILVVKNEPAGENKTVQSLIAQQNVFFRTEQYVGTADIIKYDERTDTVIFEGTNGNTVRIAQIVDGQQRPMNFNSSKVLYNRKTGKMESDGVRSLSK